MSCEYEIAVVEGLKCGARAPVSIDKKMTLGDQFDCDIVLGGMVIHDADISAPTDPTRTTLQYISENDEFSLQVVEGEIQLGELTLSAGSTTEIEPGAPVQIAGSTFVLSKVVQASSAPLPQAEQTPSNDDEEITPIPIKSNSLLKKAGFAAALSLSIAAGLTYWIDGKYFSVTAHDRATQFLNEVITRPEYAQLSIEQSGNDTIKVVGHVQQRAQLHQLREALNGTEHIVFVDVSVGEMLMVRC